MPQLPSPHPPLSPIQTPSPPAAAPGSSAAGTAADRVLAYASTPTLNAPATRSAVRFLRLSAIGLALAALLLGGIVFALFAGRGSVPRTNHWLVLLKISPFVAFLFAWAIVHWFLASKVAQGKRLFVQIAFTLALLLTVLLLLATPAIWILATWASHLLMPFTLLVPLGAAASLDLVFALGEILFGSCEPSSHRSPVSPPTPASLLPPPPHTTTSPPPPSGGAVG